MTEYIFDDNHHFVFELTCFTIALVGLNAVFGLERQSGWIDRAVDHVQNRRPGTLSIPGGFIPPMFQGVGKVANCTLLNPKEIVKAMQTSAIIPPIKYTDSPLVTPLIQPGDELQRYPTPYPSIDQVTLVAIISAFERLSGQIMAKWGRNPRGWPPIIQYFRHIRNAAAHGNRFSLRGYRGVPSIDPSNPPCWRGSTMVDDSSMNGLTLMIDWWDLGDMPIFLGDVDRVLQTEGINP